MKIAILDLEVNHKNKIKSIGIIDEFGNNIYMGSDVNTALGLLKNFNAIIGHNILNHDLKYLSLNTNTNFEISNYTIIDTLRLSSLIFIKKPYHRLIKDYKLNKENDPIQDSKLCYEVFENCVSEFNEFDNETKNLIYQLTYNSSQFNGFFEYLEGKGHYFEREKDIKTIIEQQLNTFLNKDFFNMELPSLIEQNPIELAYVCRLLILKKNIRKDISILPGWIVKNLPGTHEIFKIAFKHKTLNEYIGLKQYFGYGEFRSFQTPDGLRISQQQVVKDTLNGENVLCVFATGGGKSLTFQLPSLMISEFFPYLTIVISPLISLMKDQVDVLKNRFHTDRAGFLNSTLNPIERKITNEKIEFGGIDILYISPEMLRSKSFVRLIGKRHVERIVVDEAHCISKRGHDFRIDYMFITKFIQEMQKSNESFKDIKISCFTATAKLDVLNEIKKYFYNGIGIDLKEYKTISTRKNLSYKIIQTENEEDKFSKLIELLSTEVKDSPCIIFTKYKGEKESSTGAQSLAKSINNILGDGTSTHYHGGLASHEKREIQDKFINGEINTIVATNAFGMGVDKDNVRYVIHFSIPSSIENYLQEAGRAGRDEKPSQCIILYNNNDINESIQLNRTTEVKKNEIKGLLNAIKSKFKIINKETLIISLKELIKYSGRINQNEFEEEYSKNKTTLETKCKTALYFLEKNGFIEREFNNTKVWATSRDLSMVVTKFKEIEETNNLLEVEKEKLKELYKIINLEKLISTEDLSYKLGWHYKSNQNNPEKGIIELVKLLIENNLIETEFEISITLNGGKDSSMVHIEKTETIMNSILNKLNENIYTGNELILNKNKLNTECSKELKLSSCMNNIELLINILIEGKYIGIVNNQICFYKDLQEIKKQINNMVKNGKSLIKLLLKQKSENQSKNKNIQIEQNIKKLTAEFSNSNNAEFSYEEIESILNFLSKFNIIGIFGSIFLYNSTIQLIKGENFYSQFTNEDFEVLSDFYTSKIKQAHVMNEFCKYVNENKDYEKLVLDYFNMESDEFYNEYFKGRLGEISRPISKQKYDEIYKGLSNEQKQVLESNENILIIAGPGAGKTKCLVHKVASIILEKGFKYEEFLMLTFSRSAKFELKERVTKILGKNSYRLEIDTFHGFCFRKLGIIPNEQDLDTENGSIINKYIEFLNSDPDIILPYQVLIIDEFQDLNNEQFNLIKTIQEKSSKGEKMKIIASGDDDQNIFGFQGGDISHIQNFQNKFNAELIILKTNYRSTQNIVNFSSKFIESVSKRIKKDTKFISILELNNGIFANKGEIKTNDCSGNYINYIEELYKKSGFDGNKTCIICHDNITCLQIKNNFDRIGIKCKLLLSNIGYNASSIIEIFKFLDLCNKNNSFINIETVEDNLQKCINIFGYNKNIKIIEKGIKYLKDNFGYINLKIINEYFEGLQDDDNYEDNSNEIITISTFHKSKGKEFENVIIIFDYEKEWAKSYSNNKMRDDMKRLIYVGITRAKLNLLIIGNSKLNPYFKELKELSSNDKEIILPENNYKQFISLTSCKDIYLSYNLNKNNKYLEFDANINYELTDKKLFFKHNNKTIQIASKSFHSTVLDYYNKLYYIKEIKLYQRLWYYIKEEKKYCYVYLFKIIFEKN